MVARCSINDQNWRKFRLVHTCRYWLLQIKTTSKNRFSIWMKLLQNTCIDTSHPEGRYSAGHPLKHVQWSWIRPMDWIINTIRDDDELVLKTWRSPASVTWKHPYCSKTFHKQMWSTRFCSRAYQYHGTRI